MNQDLIDIKIIRECIERGNYSVRSHAVIHALKEGFDRQHMVEAIFDGRIIEEYPDNKRVLVCGKAMLSANTTIYVHVVCECVDSTYTDIVTAYLPDEDYWNHPPYSRRHKIKK